jgi:hypothetical protein
VEEGFEAVLSRKQRATPAVARIFDGEKEAKLIVLACSKPPKGRTCWTLRLLENKVVELGIVDRASDSTIGWTLKTTLSNRIGGSAGSIRRRRTARSQQRWKMCWPCTRGRAIPIARWFASTRPQCRLKFCSADDLAADVADEAAKSRPQQAQLPMMAVDCLAWA